MEIVGVNSSCSCVTAKASRNVLGPRESATIDITMDTRRFLGTKTATINVTVGPQYTSTATLRVSATRQRGQDLLVTPVESDSPRTLNLGTIKAGVEVTRQVIVRDSKHFRVVEVVGVDKAISLDPPRESLAMVQVLTFRCRFDTPGKFQRELKIKTSAEEAPATLTIEANVEP
jgi:hypothetical protein